MRRAALAVVTTVAALVLLLSFRTHTASPATPPAVIAAPGTGTSAGSAGSSGTAAKTVTGTAVATRYGPVQVQVTLANGRVTSASALQYPTSDPRDQQINAYAIPVLNQETVAAGSANIDMVSGATFTSVGYQQSLQSALDKA